MAPPTHMLASQMYMPCSPLAKYHFLKGKSPMDAPPFSPSPHLTVQLIEGWFSSNAIAQKHTKYNILIPHLQQLGWNTLPLNVLISGYAKVFCYMASPPSPLLLTNAIVAMANPFTCWP